MKIVAVVEARIFSVRLPGKVLKDIVGKPMLQHIIERLKKSQLTDQIVVAIADEKDSPIPNLVKNCGVEGFIGNVEDVLDRDYQVAKKYGAEIIVRICADRAVIDPQVVDKVIDFYLANRSKVDYVSNCLILSYPQGLVVEIFSFEALQTAWQNAKEPYQREHVTIYIYEHPEKYKLHNIEAPSKFHYPYYRWTVDYEEDLQFVREIYKCLYFKNPNFSTKDIINLLQAKPELIEINAHLGLKSLHQENRV